MNMPMLKAEAAAAVSVRAAPAQVVKLKTPRSSFSARIAAGPIDGGIARRPAARHLGADPSRLGDAVQPAGRHLAGAVQDLD